MLKLDTTKYTIDGSRYLVTTGTGEVSFDSRTRGLACFAYDADDASEALKASASYSDFCDAISPSDDRDVAIALATKGLRMVLAGACTPVLSDEEYAAIRDAGRTSIEEG